MHKKHKLAIALIILLGLLSVVCATGAEAKPDRNRERDGNGPRHPVHGEIISISESQIVVAPSIPPEMAERMAERGIEPPSDLPDKISISLNDKTSYYNDGEEAAAGVFAAGDTVVIAVRQGEDGPVAIAVADMASAKQYLREKFGRKEGQAGQGKRSRDGQGPGFGPGEGSGRPGGPGGRAGRGPGRPFFGEILSIDGDSITIAPEVPDFMLDKLPDWIDEPGRNLPETISFSISSETVYVVDGAKQESSPFAVGDKVAVLMKGTRDDPRAAAIADYATARQRAEDRQGSRGPGRGPGRGGQDSE